MRVRNALVIERVGEGVKITVVKNGERGGHLWSPLPLTAIALAWLNHQCPQLDRRQSVRGMVEDAVTRAILGLAGRLDGPDDTPRCAVCAHLPHACQCPCCSRREDRGSIQAQS